MNRQPRFSQSFAIFDADHCLVDWTSGFAEEFAEAAPLLMQGISAKAIYAACLLPERALDFSWAASGAQPHAFEYINNRQTVSVAQELSVGGSILRFAQSTNVVPQLHPSMLDDSTELLRSAALKISASVQKQRETETMRLNELALTDGLTGVANRRYFDEKLLELFLVFQRTRRPFTLMVIDIDHFKRVNDKHGHAYGDQVLKTLAQRLQQQVRVSDFIARYGGEEFAVLLPETPAEPEAKGVAEKIRMAVEGHRFPGELEVTISIGLSQVAFDDTELSALFERADRALYRAKEQGRNCVVAG